MLMSNTIIMLLSTQFPTALSYFVPLRPTYLVLYVEYNTHVMTLTWVGDWVTLWLPATAEFVTVLCDARSYTCLWGGRGRGEGDALLATKILLHLSWVCHAMDFDSYATAVTGEQIWPRRCAFTSCYWMRRLEEVRPGNKQETRDAVSEWCCQLRAGPANAPVEQWEEQTDGNYQLKEVECFLMKHCCSSQAYWPHVRKFHGSTPQYVAMFPSIRLAVLFSWMLVVVTFAIDKRFELVEADRMGKLRAPLSLPLRNLTSVYSVRTELPFVATDIRANRMASGDRSLNCDIADLRRLLVGKVSE